jgi:hypothetical protein
MLPTFNRDVDNFPRADGFNLTFQSRDCFLNMTVMQDKASVPGETQKDWKLQRQIRKDYC